MKKYKIIYDTLSKTKRVVKFNNDDKLIPTEDMISAAIKGVKINLISKFGVSDMLAETLLKAFSIEEMYKDKYCIAIQFGYENVAKSMVNAI